MALSNVALFGAAFLTPVVAGKITHTLGWEWTFYFVAIFAGVALPFTFFFVPETAYRRAGHIRTDFEYSNDQPTVSESQNQPSKREDASSPHQRSRELADVPAKASFLQTLKPFNGRKTDENFFKLLLRPFPLFFQPAILWVSILTAHPARVSDDTRHA